MFNVTAAATTVLAQSGRGGDWDLETFFTNATEYSKVAGGAFLSLVGIIGIIWGGTLLIKKLMSEQSRESWVKIVSLIIVGGALLFGGINLILDFAEGGKNTVENFGTGTVLAAYQLDAYLPSTLSLASAVDAVPVG